MKVIKNKYVKYIIFTFSIVLFFSLILNYKDKYFSEEELIKEVYKNKDEEDECQLVAAYFVCDYYTFVDKKKNEI